MPGRDRTGPWGQGARSGWGMGFCGGGEPVYGSGPMGFGMGMGRGWRRRAACWGRPPVPAAAYGPYRNREEWLREQRKLLQQEIGNIDAELAGDQPDNQ